MVAKVVTFDDFSGGEYGLLGGTHAPKASFTGTNVVRFLDGSIGPRPGLVDFGVTGAPVGTVLGFGYHKGQNRFWFIIGDTVYDVDASTPGTATRTLGTLAVTPPNRIRSFAEDGDHTYITVNGDKSYDLYHGAGTLAALTGSPPGRVCAVYGDRLLVAGRDNPSFRVYYSAPADFNSWPGYIDVPGGYVITVLAPFRERLVIGQHDGTWNVLSGVPGVNDVLRRMLRSLRTGNTTNGPSRWSASGDGRIWFLPEYGEYPVVFGGSSVQAFEHLSLVNDLIDGTGFGDSGSTPKIGVTGLLHPEDVFLNTGTASSGYDNQGLLFHGGLWSKHAFAKNVSGWVDGRGDLERRIFICDGGAVGAAPKFYVWFYGAQTPALSSNVYESIGDASSSVPVVASFTEPEWWSRDGSEVQAQAVAVDFKKWNHGFSPDNAFTLSLTPLYRDGGSAAVAGGNGTAVTVGSFSEAPTASSNKGTLDRRRWTLPSSTQFANGFQVTVSGLVGCAIKKIHVFYDARPTQAV